MYESVQKVTKQHIAHIRILELTWYHVYVLKPYNIIVYEEKQN